MSFTSAMRPGQPQPGGQPMNGAPQGQNVGAQAAQSLQKLFQMNQQMLQQLAKIPGLDQAKFHQAVQLFQQATHLIAEAMPKGGGMQQPGGAMPPGAPPQPMR
jgi:hypothetical protein